VRRAELGDLHAVTPSDELSGQAGRAQCRRRQILAGRIAGSAARNTHDRDPAHLGEDTSAHHSGTATWCLNQIELAVHVITSARFQAGAGQAAIDQVDRYWTFFSSPLTMRTRPARPAAAKPGQQTGDTR
jgi:hypothetical protein